MSDKTKFANLHYPGMKSDPNEGKTPLNPETKWRFENQIECIGEDAQRQLTAASVFFIASDALSVSIARKLMQVGIGRVGMFGELQAAGAHGLGSQTECSSAGTLKLLSKQAKAFYPWAQFEPFGAQSIDRRIEDMVRGFGIVAGFGGIDRIREALKMARENQMGVLVGASCGRSGWFAFFPNASFCEECVVESATELSKNEIGIYFPLLELMSADIASCLSAHAVVGLDGAIVRVFEANAFPFNIETRLLKPRSGCNFCR